MDAMERDPAYLAAKLRSFCKAHGLTQDNVAQAAGLVIQPSPAV